MAALSAWAPDADVVCTAHAILTLCVLCTTSQPALDLTDVVSAFHLITWVLD